MCACILVALYEHVYVFVYMYVFMCVQVVFIFEYGCLALFNVREADERLLARSLQKYGSGLLAEKDWSSEDFKYTYADEKDGFAVQSDTIFFRSHGSLEKLSVGYALAQCVKLSVLESRGERAIEENRGVSDSLAGSLSATGDVKMNRADIHMRLGRLFVIRSDLNLHRYVCVSCGSLHRCFIVIYIPTTAISSTRQSSFGRGIGTWKNTPQPANIWRLVSCVRGACTRWCVSANLYVCVSYLLHNRIAGIVTEQQNIDYV
jgi:hypothetical protein